MIIPFPRAKCTQPCLGVVLQGVRTARGFSLDELARESGVNAARLSLAERDQVQLCGAELHALINALHIPLGLLFCPSADLSALRTIRRAALSEGEGARDRRRLYDANPPGDSLD